MENNILLSGVERNCINKNCIYKTSGNRNVIENMKLKDIVPKNPYSTEVLTNTELNSEQIPQILNKGLNKN